MTAVTPKPKGSRLFSIIIVAVFLLAAGGITFAIVNKTSSRLSVAETVTCTVESKEAKYERQTRRSLGYSYYVTTSCDTYRLVGDDVVNINDGSLKKRWEALEEGASYKFNLSEADIKGVTLILSEEPVN